MVAARLVAITLAALAVVLAGCASSGGATVTEQRMLTPWLTLTGALLAPPAQPHGIPQFKGAPPTFRPFVGPVSAAFSAGEVYVADAGAATVFRLDLAMNAMVAVPGAPADRTTRLRVGPELSLYMLDAGGRRAVRLSRSGQLLASYSDINLGRPVDVAVEDNGAHVLVADGLYRHVVAFHPLGRAAFVVHLRGDERNRVLSVDHFALGSDALYIADGACRCIARVARDGSILETFGHHEVAQVGPIAVDRYQRVFVADQFDRSIKVFWHGKLIETVSASLTRAVQLTDLSVSGSTLAIADAGGARVHLMQIKPPPAGP